MTIPRASEIMGISYPSAQRHVEQFERLGILKLLRDAYGNIYFAPGVIRAINSDGED